MGVLKRIPPFQIGLTASVLLHAGLFWVLTRPPAGLDLTPSWARPDSIEVDLTRPHRLTADPRKAMRALNPGTGAPRVAVPTPGRTQAGGGIASKGVGWTLPTDKSKILDTPTDFGNPLSKSTVPSMGTGTVEGESRGPGGLGTGGEGEVDWVYLTERPRLLNRDELIKNTQRFYPEEERRMGREGLVRAHVHLNRNGEVTGVDIAQSAGPLFDAAAKKVLSLARFSPARAGDRVVAVKLSQPIDFRLSD